MPGEITEEKTAQARTTKLQEFRAAIGKSLPDRELFPSGFGDLASTGSLRSSRCGGWPQGLPGRFTDVATQLPGQPRCISTRSFSSEFFPHRAARSAVTAQLADACRTHPAEYVDAPPLPSSLVHHQDAASPRSLPRPALARRPRKGGSVAALEGRVLFVAGRRHVVRSLRRQTSRGIDPSICRFSPTEGHRLLSSPSGPEARIGTARPLAR